MKKHWYFIYEEYCPLCTSTRIYRTRHYGRRPKRYWKRHDTVEVYDWCDS